MLFLLSSHGYFEDLKKTNVKNCRIVCWNNVSFLYDWNLSFTEMCFVEFFSQLTHRLSQGFGLRSSTYIVKFSVASTAQHCILQAQNRVG